MLLAKEWMIESSSDRLLEVLRPYRCLGGHVHGKSMRGGLHLSYTASYPALLAALCCEACTS